MRSHRHHRFITVSRAWAAILALILASLLSCALLGIRALYFHQSAYVFFVWNLFLAWVPAVAALAFYTLAHRTPRRRGLLAGIGIVWLLFFPNAAYIVTDIVHLQARAPVPYWFDLIGIVTLAQTGLFLGYLSLYLMQEVVRAWVGRWYAWAFALLMLGLSAFGIYLGRFQRWNSWDVLIAPIDTFRTAASAVNPWISIRPLAFSAMFFAFSLVCYLIVYSFTHLHGWTSRQPHELPKN
jgi:uncharacterized membrane protein